jgi:hypothetical protein
MCGSVLSDMQADDIKAHKQLLATAQRAIADREQAAARTAEEAHAAKDRLARVEQGEAIAGIPAPMTRQDLLRITGMTEAQARRCEQVAEIADAGGFQRLLMDKLVRRDETSEKAVVRKLHGLLRLTQP